MACSLRIIVVMNAEKKEILYCTRFPTVEKRAKALYPTLKPIGDENEILNAILERQDSPSFDDPVLLYGTKSGIWPYLFVSKKDYYVIGVPMVDPSLQGTALSLIHMPYITATVVFLENVLSYVLDNPSQIGEPAFQNLMSVMVPFGKPAISTLGDALTALQQKSSISDIDYTAKSPNWRIDPPRTAGSMRQSPVVDIEIVETINAHQYDTEIPNKIYIHGSVYCKTTLEGGNPELTVQLTSTAIPPIVIGQVNAHSSVQNLVPESKKMIFIPPPSFRLCTYVVDGVNRIMPLRGFYQMKENSLTEAHILLQVKLEKFYANEFEYCRCIIPFHNRGLILSSKDTPTAGSISIREDRKAIVWNIGTKFTSHKLEVRLASTINFEEEMADNTNDDPFLVGPNSYARLEFKIEGTTIGDIESKNVSIYPKCNALYACKRSTCSGEYLIWNTWGSARFAVDVPTGQQQGPTG